MSWHGIRYSLRLLSETFSKWSDANDFALPLRSLAGLAQEQEAGVRGGAARGGGGPGVNNASLNGW